MANDPLGEYEDRLTVDAPANEVFDFLADVQNLPKYLPTTKQAQSQSAARRAGAPGHVMWIPSSLHSNGGAARSIELSPSAPGATIGGLSLVGRF
jgi:uncharacterized membrane protein